MPNPYIVSPELNVKDITDLYLRTNFQNLSNYYARQNQFLDFQFLEIIFSAAESNRRVRHGLAVIPHDLVRLEVTGTGVVTWHRNRFDKNFLVVSSTGPARVRLFVGQYFRSPIDPGVKSTDEEQWYAFRPEGGGDGGVNYIPEGGAVGDFLEKSTEENFALAWENGTFSGYSARYNETFEQVGLRDVLLQILNFSYVAPAIVLTSSTSQALREKGTTVASVPLVATTTKRSNDITQVTFYKNGVLVSTVSSPSPGGGAENYTDGSGFTDTTTYFARVTDGTGTVQSNTLTFSYVYPYYYGVGAPGLSAAAVGGLTKSIIANTASVARQFSPTNQVYYFAYPAAYPALTSILDTNGFETIGDWTVRTENITGLDGNAVSYRIYEFSNLTTQTNFTNTFRQ